MNRHPRLLVRIDGEPAYPAVAVFAVPGDKGLLWLAPGYLNPQVALGGERFGGSALGPLQRAPRCWTVRGKSHVVEVVPFPEGRDLEHMREAFEDHERRVAAKGWSRKQECARLKRQNQSFLDGLASDVREAG